MLLACQRYVESEGALAHHNSQDSVSAADMQCSGFLRTKLLLLCAGHRAAALLLQGLAQWHWVWRCCCCLV